MAAPALDAVLLDEVALELDELARACSVDTAWVMRHVQAGLLCSDEAGLGADAQAGGDRPVILRFYGSDLTRALRLLQIERDFDADEQLAALVVDLADEVRRLRTRLRVMGVGDR